MITESDPSLALKSGEGSGSDITPRRIRRFWAQVDRRPNGCWLWKGKLGSTGYARTLVGSGSSRKHWQCHRLAYRITHGHLPPVSSGLVVMHVCDVRHCVNPAHLRLDTPRENVLDAIRKGRNKPPRPSHLGETNGRAKLTRPQAEEIRASTASARVVAAKYGVSPGLVYYIKNLGGWAPA